MTLPLLRPLTDAEVRQTLAVLALWCAVILAAPVCEALARIAWSVAECLGNPLCR
jgi:hypothetical protein